MAASETRVTRNRLLKRAGVGAAVLGAGSMLTASTASANFPPSKECIEAGGCGSAQPQCGACAFCLITTEGCCFCHESSFCAGLQGCTASSQCPPGWACAYSNCGGGATAFCLPHGGACNHHTACCNNAQVKPTGATSGRAK